MIVGLIETLYLDTFDYLCARRTAGSSPLNNNNAHLVLGVNNHHVISYYWARSVGSGTWAAAPGVELVNGNQLQWSSSTECCQTNDGKRSEWVAFLRRGDTVQLCLDERWNLFRTMWQFSQYRLLQHAHV